jgi:diadenosine tetraphosphate (Ap4A) HIT family hydrolase
MHDCPLCGALDGVMIFEHNKLRVIRAMGESEASFPAFYRVVWRAHVRELSDLSGDEIALCMRAVVEVERVMRERLTPAPEKINVASLGNVVPHLHWHVIARYVWDTHWPKPVWAQVERGAHEATLQDLRTQLPAVDQAMRNALHSALLG